MYQQDWLMNQIDNMVQIITSILFKKVATSNSVLKDIHDIRMDSLHLELQEKLNQLDINEAENILFNRIDTNELHHLIVAVNFYKGINELSDEQLDRSNYTRSEIKDGLMEITQLFGLVEMNGGRVCIY